MIRSGLGAARRHPWLSAAFLLALVLTLAFAGRAAVFAVYWADPAHRDQDIAGWMTPRYVAHSWQVPPEVLRAALGPAAQPGARMTLAEIARAEGVPLEALAERLEAAIAAHRGAAE